PLSVTSCHWLTDQESDRRVHTDCAIGRPGTGRQAGYTKAEALPQDCRSMSSIKNADEDANDIEEAIERIVAKAPPLTNDQRNRISALLRTGKGHNRITT